MMSLQMLRRRLAGTRIEAWLRAAGAGRWALRRYERRILAAGRRHVCVAGFELVFAVRSRSELTRVDLLGVGEQAMLRRLLGCLRRGDVVFDIGANIGTHAVLLARQLERLGGGRVVACEPNPDSAHAARENVGLNRLMIDVHAVALGAEDGTATLLLNGDAGCGTHTLCAATGTGGTGRLPVPVRRGDTLARELRLAPSVVKVDVEGWELAVLEGLLGRGQGGSVRELFVELHPSLLAAQGQSEEQLVRFMAAQGLRSVWRAPRGGEVHHHFVRAGADAANAPPVGADAATGAAR